MHPQVRQQTEVHNPPRAAGFTLVELVIVIVLLGILSVGTVQFINDSTMGYANSVVRSELASGAQSVLDRLSRELRDALPRSVRVSADGACLEYLPVVGGTSYLSVPTDSPATEVLVVPPDPRHDRRYAVGGVSRRRPVRWRRRRQPERHRKQRECAGCR